MNDFDRAMIEIDKIKNTKFKKCIASRVDFELEKAEFFDYNYNTKIKVIINTDVLLILKIDNYIYMYNSPQEASDVLSVEASPIILSADDIKCIYNKL